MNTPACATCGTNLEVREPAQTGLDYRVVVAPLNPLLETPPRHLCWDCFLAEFAQQQGRLL